MKIDAIKCLKSKMTSKVIYAYHDFLAKKHIKITYSLYPNDLFQLQVDGTAIMESFSLEPVYKMFKDLIAPKDE